MQQEPRKLHTNSQREEEGISNCTAGVKFRNVHTETNQAAHQLMMHDYCQGEMGNATAEHGLKEQFLHPHIQLQRNLWVANIFFQLNQSCEFIVCCSLS